MHSPVLPTRECTGKPVWKISRYCLAKPHACTQPSRSQAQTSEKPWLVCGRRHAVRTSAGPSKTLGPAASPVGEKVANQTGSAVGTRDGERAAAAANTRRISGTTPRGKATCRGSHRVARRLYEPQRPVYTERRRLDDGVMHTRLGIPAPLRERRGVHQDGAGRRLGLVGRAVSRRGRWFRSARRS